MRSYQKILHLGDTMLDRLLEGEVNIEEKIDGSMGRVMITPEGDILCGSKRVEFINQMDSGFRPMVDAVNKAFAGYKPEHTTHIFGEYLGSPKHNTLSYSRIPKNHFMIFDVMEESLQKNIWLGYEAKRAFSESFGFEVSPLLHSGDGKMITTEFIKDVLKTQSVLGNEIIEGIVIKNYDQYFDVVKHPWLEGMWMAGKYVRSEFKERNGGEWAGKKVGVEQIKLNIPKITIWQKSIQHLRDDGKLQNNMKDMAILIDEVKKDFVEEQKEFMKEELWEVYGRAITGEVVKGLPEYYKDRLLENI